MRPLATAEFVLTWLFLYPLNATTSIWKKMAYMTFTIVIITVQAFGIIAGIVFIAKFIMVGNSQPSGSTNNSLDLQKAIFVSAVVFCHACTLYMGFIAFLLRKKIPTIFSDLSKIYRECKIHIKSIEFYFYT